MDEFSGCLDKAEGYWSPQQYLGTIREAVFVMYDYVVIIFHRGYCNVY